MSKLIPSIIVLAVFEGLRPSEQINPFNESLEDWAEIAQILNEFIADRKAVRYSEIKQFVVNYDLKVYEFDGPSVDVGYLLLNELKKFA